MRPRREAEGVVFERSRGGRGSGMDLVGRIRDLIRVNIRIYGRRVDNRLVDKAIDEVR